MSCYYQVNLSSGVRDVPRAKYMES